MSPLRLTAAVSAWLCLAGPAMAEQVFADPDLEARAQAIGRQLRCVVCAGQSVAQGGCNDGNKQLRVDERKRLYSVHVRARLYLYQ